MPMKDPSHPGHRSGAKLALAITVLASASVAAQPFAGAEPSLDLRYRHQQSRFPEFIRSSSAVRLERAIQASAAKSVWELGIATSRQALVDCQAGSYPGANFGPLGSAQSRPEAQPDHCRRF
jgi:hypothetical protein